MGVANEGPREAIIRAVSTGVLLSIITPCLNAGRFLPRSLESVAMGAHEAAAAPGEIEHIIVDGGSTDGSVEVIRAHAAAHPSLVTHWSSQADQGQSDAINRGMALARGRYAAWLNADDWYEPGGVAAVLSALRREDAPDVVVGRCRFVNEDGRVEMEPRPPMPVSLAALLSLRSRWFAGECLVQPEVFFQLDVFRRLGGLNTANHYTMDHELWCRMVLAGARFAHVDALVASAGVHEGQKTRNNREVARSMLRYALPMSREHGAILGTEATRVRAELEGIQNKLLIADEVIRWWQRWMDAPDSSRQAMPRELQPRLPEGSDDACSRSLRAAARALRWRRRLRIGFVECDTRIVTDVSRRLKRRRMEVHIAGGSRPLLAESAAALRPILSTRSEVATHHGLLGAGRMDLIVTQLLSSRVDAPASVVGDLWSRLAPGGVLLQLDDPMLSAAMRRYIGFLTMRLGDSITHDNDVLLHEDVDGVLHRIARQPQPVPPGMLMLSEIVPMLSRAARCLHESKFGTPENHPLTPFAVLGPPEMAAITTWASSAWQRE